MTMLLFFTFFITIQTQISITTSQKITYPNCSSPLYKQNSTYDNNLHDLLATLAKQASSTGFQNYSVGDGSNRVYGVYLCRGDLTIPECSACVQEAHSVILWQCSFSVWAAIWYEFCMLRYSNVSIFGKMDTDPKWIFGNNRQNVSSNNYQAFLETLNKTSSELVTKVTNSTIKFATNVGNVPGISDQLFILGQCTPDLTSDDCARCLRIGASQFPIPMYGGRVLLPSCNLRFEFNEFYMSDTPVISFEPLSIGNSPNKTVERRITPPSPSKSRSRVVIIAVTISATITILLAVGVCVYIYRRQRARFHEIAAKLLDNNGSPMQLEEVAALESLQFDFKMIKDATNNFSEHNKLGQGGFGLVYKGTLQNGQQIAVKRLLVGSHQGSQEFKTEVLLVAKLQHKNLVKFLGFCIHREERLLVYELLPNASLDKVLFDRKIQTSLDWETRYKILLGTARGLLYLHEDSRLKIIHRDLKSSNVLLDEEMNAKIADFGMARLIGADQSQADTSKIVGTYGYMAPEYSSTGRFSIMSDVYSFGVIALEIVSGHKCSSTAFPFEDESLTLRAWNLWKDGAIFDLVDSRLDGNFSSEEVRRSVRIGLLCIEEDAYKRPTMGQIVSALNGHLVSLVAPESPCVGSITMVHDEESQIISSTISENKDDITEVYPR